jgi:hypothetical protein
MYVLTSSLDWPQLRYFVIKNTIQKTDLYVQVTSRPIIAVGSPKMKLLKANGKGMVHIPI